MNDGIGQVEVLYCSAVNYSVEKSYINGCLVVDDYIADGVPCSVENARIRNDVRPVAFAFGNVRKGYVGGKGTVSGWVVFQSFGPCAQSGGIINNVSAVFYFVGLFHDARSRQLAAVIADEGDAQHGFDACACGYCQCGGVVTVELCLDAPSASAFTGACGDVGECSAFSLWRYLRHNGLVVVSGGAAGQGYLHLGSS